MDILKQTKKFFIKFFILSLFLILIRKIFGLNEALIQGLILLSALTVMMILAPKIGVPFFQIFKSYEKKMGESGIFLHMAALILFLTGLYRYEYVFKRLFCLASDFSCGDAAHFMLVAAITFTAAFTPVKEPVFRIWMKFAHLLQSVVSRIILTVIFILTVIPLSIAAKLAGKKFLVMKPDTSAVSYWETPDPALFEKERYRKPF